MLLFMVLIQECIQTSLVNIATALHFMIAPIRLDWLMIVQSVWSLMLCCSASGHVSILVCFLVANSWKCPIMQESLYVSVELFCD